MRTVVWVWPELLSRLAPSVMAAETVPALSALHAVSSSVVCRQQSQRERRERVPHAFPQAIVLLPPV